MRHIEGSVTGRRLRTAAIIVAAALSVLPQARAADPAATRVYIGDLDLGTPRGRRVLQRRIAAAIEQVCVPHGSALLPTPRTRREVHECREQALAGVRAQLARRGVPPEAALARAAAH